jgi:hypothetical protein
VTSASAHAGEGEHPQWEGGSSSASGSCAASHWLLLVFTCEQVLLERVVLWTMDQVFLSRLPLLDAGLSGWLSNGRFLSELAVCHWPSISFNLGESWLSFLPDLQLNRVNGTSSPQSPLSTSGRVAAVGPYIQVPSAGSYPIPGDPVKPQSLTITSSAAHGRSKSGEWPWLSSLNSVWEGKNPWRQ